MKMAILELEYKNIRKITAFFDSYQREHKGDEK